MAAPAFEALDKDNSITRLKTFLGRHELFVVFFDGETGAAADPTLSAAAGRTVEGEEDAEVRRSSPPRPASTTSKRGSSNSSFAALVPAV